jgi:FAD/FMN-containing dehydrogenase
MGIVTWASIKCNLLPKVNKTLFFPAESIDRLIDFTYKLLWKKLGDQCLILNSHNLSCILSENAESIESMRDRIPPWVLIMNIEGSGLMPHERVAYQGAEVMEVAQSYGLEPVVTLSEMRAEDVLNVLSQPSPEPYWKLRFKAGSHDILFLTTLDRCSEFVSRMHDLTAACHFSSRDVGIYLQPTVQGTNCHCEFSVPYEPDGDDVLERVMRLDHEASSAFANMGGFFSRPYEQWSKIAYGRCPETVAGLRKIKEIFDPNGIMNPGKL